MTIDSVETTTPSADLHIHTTASDGILTVEELPKVAHKADVDTIAVTDHDRVHPELTAPVSTHDSVTIIRGIELRVSTSDQRLDLLGYAVRQTDSLMELTSSIQQNRKERGAAMIDAVESYLDVTLDIDIREGLGRPDIARAIDESDAAYDYSDAFGEVIGSGDPCYIQRDIPSFETGAAVLSDACAVVGLAHPFRYPDPDAALEYAKKLDAVERYYAYGNQNADHADPADIEDIAADNDLLLIGGSDAHDRTIGVTGPPPTAFEPFATQISYN
jgi:Predicted metal-dependent phosphoesterases (PHP family)